MKFLEIKRHVNKPDETYTCDLVGRGSDYVVLKYVSDRPWRVCGEDLEAGTITLAHYRAGAGSVAWKMVGQAGDLKGYLFHICKDLAVLEDRVTYLDLLLDLWFDGTGACTVLDRDELEVCREKGQVSGVDLAWILGQEQEIKRNFGRIRSELEEVLEALI